MAEMGEDLKRHKQLEDYLDELASNVPTKHGINNATLACGI
jgi:hypothetical protein